MVNNNDKVLWGLKKVVSDLIVDLKLLFDKREERGDLITVEFFYQRLHPQQIMNNVIEKMIPFSQQIQNKDLNFFKENTSIFSSLPDSRVQYYKDQILGDRFDKENIDMLWEYLDAMVAYGEVYINNNKRS